MKNTYNGYGWFDVTTCGLLLILAALEIAACLVHFGGIGN